MATRLTTIKTVGSTVPSAIGTYKSMLTSGLTTSYITTGATVTMPDGDKKITTSFYSERVDADVTISGTVTFNAWCDGTATTTVRGRIKLSKVTGAGSSAIETPICQQDTVNPITDGPAKYTITATPSVPVTLAVGERVILRFYWTPVDGSFGSGTPTISFGEDVDLRGNTWVELTETVVFRPDITQLILRRTSANGIGNFFDMLEAWGGSAFTSGVVNTSASGTQIQWTRTAGGTALEWISPRLHHPGWNFAVDANVNRLKFYAYESNDAANCTLRCKVFRRSVQGVETLIYTYSYSVTEFPAGPVSNSMQITTPIGGTVVPAVFEEDDRIVLRAYIINFGTMASGHTCTLNYDHSSTGDGNSFIQCTEAPRFKSESDPPKSYRVVGGLTMGGVGN